MLKIFYFCCTLQGIQREGRKIKYIVWPLLSIKPRQMNKGIYHFKLRLTWAERLEALKASHRCISFQQDNNNKTQTTFSVYISVQNQRQCLNITSISNANSNYRLIFLALPQDFWEVDHAEPEKLIIALKPVHDCQYKLNSIANSTFQRCNGLLLSIFYMGGY